MRNNLHRALFTIAGWGLFFAVLYVVATTKHTLTVYDPFSILGISPASLRTLLQLIMLIYVPSECDGKANKETLQTALPQIVRNQYHIRPFASNRSPIATQTQSSSQKTRRLTTPMIILSNSQRHTRPSPTKKSGATSSNTATQTANRPSALVSLSPRGSSTRTTTSGSSVSTEFFLAGSSPTLSYVPFLLSVSQPALNIMSRTGPLVVWFALPNQGWRPGCDRLPVLQGGNGGGHSPEPPSVPQQGSRDRTRWATQVADDGRVQVGGETSY
jgi:hypothetical protein